MTETTKTTTVKPTVKTRKRKVVIEYKYDGGPEWWLMHHDGRIEVFDTASAAFRAVSKAANRGNKGITITTIEWRDTPDGFVPPAGEKK